MKTAIKIFLLLNALGAIMVGMQGLFTTQIIMDPVGIQLSNPSALISIMASYGGVNVIFAIFYIYAAFRAQTTGLLLYSMYAGGFVLGRIIGFLQVGPGNSFVMTWFCIESVFVALAIFFLIKTSKEKLS
jgi:hypothetical protein